MKLASSIARVCHCWLVQRCIFGHMLLLAMLAIGNSAAAQFSASPRFHLSGVVRVDEADNQALATLTRVDELLAANQFDEALEALDRLAAEHGRKLIAIEPRRYITLRDFRHVRIAALPADGLALYRRRVDAAAAAAYRRAIEQRDEAQLQAVVDLYFCSTIGDEALVALGDFALERADYTAARRCYLALFEQPPAAIASDRFAAMAGGAKTPPADRELLNRFYRSYEPPPRIPPVGKDPIDAANGAESPDKEPPRATAPNPSPDAKPPASAAKPPAKWHVAVAEAWNKMTDAESAALVRLCKTNHIPSTRLAYPATDRPLAEVRARLILVDLLSGNLGEAADKLERFRALHPKDRGALGGQTVVLADRLGELLAQARQSPAIAPPAGWPTFAHALDRAAQIPTALPKHFTIGAPAWRVTIGKPNVSNVEIDRNILERQPRIGESWDRILAYHPVVVGRKVFLSYPAGVAAIDLATGRFAWADPSAAPPEKFLADDCLIFRDADGAPLRTNQWPRGVARFTLSVDGDMLLARTGSPATSFPIEGRSGPPRAPSRIAAFDVSDARQGRLVARPWSSDDERIAIDGAPISDGRFVYTTLRRSDVRPEVLVACYDMAVDPPRQRWRTMVASAETPGSGRLYECTHNLLSLAGDTLYLNTNLGAVAALSTADGSIRWLTVHASVHEGDVRKLQDTGHFYRDLTPCLLYRDLAIVAPFDSPAIFALDAATGAPRWSTDAAPDVIHLLGVNGDVLWASGDRLLAFDVRTGRLVSRWPEGPRADPRGFGRGLVVGGSVLWPTRDQLFVFDSPLQAGEKQPLVPRPGAAVWSRHQVFGGNLVWAGDSPVGGYLLVATDAELVAFRLAAPPAGDSPSDAAASRKSR
jgi:outer membrane protein assembly factor BamB